MLLGQVETSGRGSVPLSRERALGLAELDRDEGPGLPARRRAAGGRRPTGGPGGDRLGHPDGVDPRRPAVMCAGAAHDHRLPEHPARGRRLHPRRLRGHGGLRRGRGPGRVRCSTTSTTCRTCSRSSRSSGLLRPSQGDGLVRPSGAGQRSDWPAQPGSVDDAIATIGPDDLATLIYTSGTTGRPKGVRLVQDSWTYLGAAIEALDIIYPDDLQYLWLPLSHVFGKA